MTNDGEWVSAEFLALDCFLDILFNDKCIVISPATDERVNACFEFLKGFAENKVIYGVNTGFGPMAQYRVRDENRVALQYNLIRSHASGVGRPLPELMVRAVILTRMHTLTLGKSGVCTALIHLMKDLLNKNVFPVIFEHGGVGASGDLVQLAHLALALIGEGEVFYKGRRMPTAEAFAAEGLMPAKMEIREGLALMNGTSVMTGIGAVNVHYARKLLRWSVALSCAVNEIVQAYDDHFSEPLNAAKRHPGQRDIAAMMRAHLADSSLLRKREDHLYSDRNNEAVFKEKVQEYYSLRCVPQILGPVLDTIRNTARVVEDELNSANDNPITDVAGQHVYHGGNFHGDYIALEMDKLKIVVCKLGMLAERQLNYLLNAGLNEILPPFVNLGVPGFNFGMQGAQFTATSTAAENQMLSNPMYVHSIPSNNDNQDIVSMGTNAALTAARVIENAFEILAVEAITVVQAIDALGQSGSVSSATLKIHQEIRERVPAFSEDVVMYPLIRKVKDYLTNN
jgi:histidine ammonia-lyase